jgi:hypothetical protein
LNKKKKSGAALKMEITDSEVTVALFCLFCVSFCSSTWQLRYNTGGPTNNQGEPESRLHTMGTVENMVQRNRWGWQEEWTMWSVSVDVK